jgi:hypothetical protein
MVLTSSGSGSGSGSSPGIKDVLNPFKSNLTSAQIVEYCLLKPKSIFQVGFKLACKENFLIFTAAICLVIFIVIIIEFLVHRIDTVKFLFYYVFQRKSKINF